jgi:hypothetical protein
VDDTQDPEHEVIGEDEESGENLKARLDHFQVSTHSRVASIQ